MPRRDDARDLLFNSDRDFLVKSNSDELVMREQLEPKVVVLQFEHLTPDYNTTWLSTAHLTDIYNELLSDVDRPFEVVFIAVGDGKEDEFRDMFCSMPWTAVPFSDSVARKQLAKKFIASE
ncbi:hypothetical protein DCAR_0729402 [Daucus carota subsp. sativus]|uniref:protein-disulfide reductase n=1 Tax=Daucus carota subsp. sativus TaxID=79200 RepID=A0A164U6H0_DAUCS|nr:hypothetical protein DCAR_0729402 [Daucus carota subsp. sativus]